MLVFGLAFERNELAALAMETDLTDNLSTDYREGKLTVPIRLVGRGGSTTLIRRVLLLVDSPIELEIARAEIWSYCRRSLTLRNPI